MGRRDAPIGWADRDADGAVWHVDNALLNFVEHRHGLARSTAAPGERLRAHLDEIVHAIADRPAEWWREYEAYRAARLEQLRRAR